MKTLFIHSLAVIKARVMTSGTERFPYPWNDIWANVDVVWWSMLRLYTLVLKMYSTRLAKRNVMHPKHMGESIFFEKEVGYDALLKCM